MYNRPCPVGNAEAGCIAHVALIQQTAKSEIREGVLHRFFGYAELTKEFTSHLLSTDFKEMTSYCAMRHSSLAFQFFFVKDD